METTQTQALNLDRARYQPRLWQLAAFFGLTVCGLAQPNITRQPTNQLVSLGATAQFRVSAASTSPLTFQWRHEDNEIVGATTATFSITNAQVLDAGNYTVVVSDAVGSVTSQPAMLDVDPIFTKIMTGALGSAKGHWHGAAWADYDNDGYPDLYVHQFAPAVKDLLFRNNGDGTFTQLDAPIPQGLTAQNGAWGNAWGDYDNDGHLDLFISNNGGRNVLLHNRGDHTFERIAAGPGAEGTDSTGPVWGDYDRDGYLDLFVANGYMSSVATRHWFYRNQGDGTFLKMTTNEVGSLASARVAATFGSWVDYDEDGWLDLFLPTNPARDCFYRNQGDGSFAPLTNGVLVDSAFAFAWADYDNDGRLDVCVGGYGTPTALYHNEGAGTFKKMSAAEVGSLVNDKSWGGGVAWGDYDNDGFVDLFVGGGWWNANNQAVSAKSFLYHNNGDGTFTRIERGSLANDVSESMGVHWVDYDRDGFLDLFLTHHASLSLAPNLLYRNSGNSNNWLCVKCVGTSSPRFGTGAKIRARATIRGKEMWQLRLIDAGGTCWGGQSFEANFGLGDALVVDTLRIEWPSGIVQELPNVPARQILTVTESPRLEMTQAGDLKARCWTGQSLSIETSVDLRQWQPWATLTNQTGILEFKDDHAAQHAARFYRAVKP